MRLRVMLADDHPLFLTGLRALLENECEVVGVATDGRAVVEAASRLPPLGENVRVSLLPPHQINQ